MMRSLQHRVLRRRFVYLVLAVIGLPIEILLRLLFAGLHHPAERGVEPPYALKTGKRTSGGVALFEVNRTAARVSSVNRPSSHGLKVSWSQPPDHFQKKEI
jgi:hypothetical protein